MIARALPALVSLLAACTPGDDDRPAPLWEPERLKFGDTPFPDDRFLDDQGHPIYEDFPNPSQVQLLKSYIAELESTPGWGANSPVWFPLDGPVDPERLPSPAESVEVGSSLILVDVDPDSAHWGEATPLQWTFEAEGTAYYPDNFLAMAPFFGIPLRPGTTYAAILTTEAFAPNEAFQDRFLEADDDETDEYALIHDVLFLHDLGPDEVAAASVFTVGQPLREMALITGWMKEALQLPNLNKTLEPVRSNSLFQAARTHYWSPLFTHGERPYSYSGGAFVYDGAGTPVLAGWDDMRAMVCVPTDLTQPPSGGWPVVVVQHGTGGDYESFCRAALMSEEASRLAGAGFVGIGIDQPLHGTRNGDYPYEGGRDFPEEGASDLDHFNILNVDSGRTNFRQGAIDAVWLAHALSHQDVVMTMPNGALLPLDRDRVYFLGHSQGGLTGGLALPFFQGDVKGAVLSGAGGVLATTILERKDPLDFEELVRGLLGMTPEESLTELHPVLGLIQHAVDVTDPVNYAPYWFAEEGGWGNVPTPVLLTSGTKDDATPYLTAISLAGAARLSPQWPRATSTPVLSLRGLPDLRGPIEDNGLAFDGTAVTAGFSQWRGGSHFVIYEIPEAAEMYAGFLRSAADGKPVIVRPGQPSE